MNKVLVVFYSKTGTSRRLAQTLCTWHGWSIGEIRDRDPRVGAWGIIRCVLDSLLRRTPPIDYGGPPPEQADTVVLVAPIWAGRLAGPMRSFLASRSHVLPPQVAHISVMEGHGAPNALAEVGQLLRRKIAVHAAITSREVADGVPVDRLRAFSEALSSQSATAHPGKPGDADRLPASA